MARRGTRALWLIAAAFAAITVAAVFVDPTELWKEEVVDELSTVIERAATYYEFEHFDRAAESYQEAADLGMTDGIEWYRFARSVEQSSGLDLEKYVTTYRLLLQQASYHAYFEETETVLARHAVPFSYGSAVDGTHEKGTLMVATGVVSQVKRGRSSSGVDTLYVDTKPDDWFGYMGDPIRVVAPKHRSYQSGDTVTAIGWYDGWQEIGDDAGLSTSYPSLIAAGVVPNR
jgi:hypothetical protein